MSYSVDTYIKTTQLLVYRQYELVYDSMITVCLNTMVRKYKTRKNR